MTTIKLKTWYCPACPYHQDYDAADNDLHALHHPDVPATLCPACFYGRNPERVQRESDLLVQDDPDKQVSINIIGEEEGSTRGKRGQAAWATSRNQRGRRPRRLTGGGGTVQIKSLWTDHR